MSKTLLITGATGKQGGAVIDNLLDSDFEILAVTRNKDSASAQKLAAKSPKIKLVQGNLDDSEAIFKNAREATDKPIWGVFSVQIPMGGGQTPQSEEKQGKDLVDAALANNVKHFVYTSVDRGGAKSSSNPTYVPHFISKHNIEQHLFSKMKNGEMTWTVLRPVAFLDNFANNMQGKIFATVWKTSLGDKPLQLIAVKDIGWFGAEAFKSPEKHAGKAYSLAGADLSFDEANKIFHEKVGKNIPVTFGIVASGLLWAVKEVGIMFKWFKEEGYGSDIEELKKIHPKLTDFGTYLEKEFKSA